LKLERSGSVGREMKKKNIQKIIKRVRVFLVLPPENHTKKKKKKSLKLSSHLASSILSTLSITTCSTTTRRHVSPRFLRPPLDRRRFKKILLLCECLEIFF
jgi:hypothetical protein